MGSAPSRTLGKKRLFRNCQVRFAILTKICFGVHASYDFWSDDTVPQSGLTLKNRNMEGFACKLANLDSCHDQKVCKKDGASRRNLAQIDHVWQCACFGVVGHNPQVGLLLALGFRCVHPAAPHGAARLVRQAHFTSGLWKKTEEEPVLMTLGPVICDCTLGFQIGDGCPGDGKLWDFSWDLPHHLQSSKSLKKYPEAIAIPDPKCNTTEGMLTLGTVRPPTRVCWGLWAQNAGKEWENGEHPGPRKILQSKSPPESAKMVF